MPNILGHIYRWAIKVRRRTDNGNVFVSLLARLREIGHSCRRETFTEGQQCLGDHACCFCVEFGRKTADLQLCTVATSIECP